MLFYIQVTIKPNLIIMKTKFLVLTVLTLLFILACQTDGEDDFVDDSLNKEIPTKEPLYVDLDLPTWSFSDSNNGQNMSTANKSENREVVLYMAEYITSGDDDEMGNIVFFNNRGNKQLGADFVPDSQYNIFIDQTNDISYYIDENRPSDDVGVGISTQAIERSMTTWDGITCSELGVFKRPSDSGVKTGVVAGYYGYGDYVHPIYGWVADVVHSGWLPGQFFDDRFFPGASKRILGVTFTFIIVIDGVPSDDDNDGKYDVWFREIYYNDHFSWADNGGHFDIETVALHEAGHGLSQGHFGKAFRGVKNEKLHFAPRAVMNASYSGLQTDIGKTDKAGHCSNWGQWPNN